MKCTFCGKNEKESFCILNQDKHKNICADCLKAAHETLNEFAAKRIAHSLLYIDRVNRNDYQKVLNDLEIDLSMYTKVVQDKFSKAFRQMYFKAYTYGYIDGAKDGKNE